MSKRPHQDLSRRERQIIDILYANGRATAAEVQSALPDPPSYSAVRAMLRILEDKGHLKHTKRGREFVFQPTHRRERTGKSMFLGVLRTFFEGSLEKAVAAHLADPDAEISPDELQRLSALIRRAKDKGNDQ